GQEIQQTINEAERMALREEAASILEADDPIVEYQHEIRRLGYGGAIKPPTIIVVCCATRLLSRGQGALLGHLQINGQSSVGKTYATDLIIRKLHPPECYVRK